MDEQDRVIPGQEYTIDHIKLDSELSTIKVRELPGYWGIGWFRSSYA